MTKNIVVTGGSRGIGLAIVRRYLRAGHNVAVVHRQSTHDQVVLAEREELSKLGACFYRCNLANEDQRRRLIQTLYENLGSVDAIVHSAAMAVFRETTDTTPRHLRHSFEVSVVALLDLVNGLLPIMAAPSDIVVLSSIGARRAQKFYAAAGIAKAALESLVIHYAQDLGSRGIRANIVCSGLVLTDAVASLPNLATLITETNSKTPSGRMTTTEDVAALVYSITDGDLRQITGERIVIDGGYEAMS